jgi:hypothetical protein
MRVSGHQPAFLPWAGFWHKLLSVDAFVLSAGVQWAKDGYLNRIQHQGAWLTVPVDASDTAPIIEVLVGEDRRRISKTWKAVAQVSGHYKHRLNQIIEILRYLEPGACLATHNVRLIKAIADELGVQTKLVPSLIAGDGVTKTDRLDARLRKAAPDMSAFYMGQGTASYFEADRFKRVPCFVQDPSSFKGSPSIVQLISNEPDPIDWIMSRGRWVELAR